MLLVVHVGDPLEEDQREDELLVVAGVDQPAQQHGRAPQVRLKLALGDAFAEQRRVHASSPHFESSASSAARVWAAAWRADFRSMSAWSRVIRSPVAAGATYSGMFRFHPLRSSSARSATWVKPGLSWNDW